MSPLIIALRLTALAVALASVIVVCRVVTVLPASLAFALSIVAALLFAYRYERSADE